VVAGGVNLSVGKIRGIFLGFVIFLELKNH